MKDKTQEQNTNHNDGGINQIIEGSTFAKFL
jgi:hypothetical protein